MGVSLLAPTHKTKTIMKAIACKQISQFPTPHSGRWAVSGAATGIALVLLAAYITGQLSNENMDGEPKVENDECNNYYVFCSFNGNRVVLSEFEVYNIKQMHEDGVSPHVIAKKYKISTIMVCKIIETTKNFKTYE